MLLKLYDYYYWFHCPIFKALVKEEGNGFDGSSFEFLDHHMLLVPPKKTLFLLIEVLTAIGENILFNLLLETGVMEMISFIVFSIDICPPVLN